MKFQPVQSDRSTVPYLTPQPSLSGTNDKVKVGSRVTGFYRLKCEVKRLIVTGKKSLTLTLHVTHFCPNGRKWHTS